MYRLYPILFFLLALLGGITMALAQGAPQVPSQIDGCVYTAAGVTFPDGVRGALQCNASGQLLTSASVSASITPLEPTTKATLSVSGVSARVALPSGTTSALCNLTSTTGYYKFGDVTVTAAVTDLTIQGGECIALSPGVNTYIAGITASGTTTFDITGGAGLPTFAFGPASAVSSNLAQVAGTTVATDNGVSGAGVQRMTIASNSTGFFTATGATAPTQALLSGSVYNSTPITLTNGQAGGLQADANGFLKVNVAAGGASGGTSSSFAAAFPATGTADGVLVVSTPPTYVAGNMQGLTETTAGRLIVDPSQVTSPVSLASLPSLATGSNVIGAVTESGTWTVATNADAAIAPGAAPSKALVTGGVYNSTPPTLTNGQTAALQLDVDGSTYANIRDWTVASSTVLGKVAIDQTTPGTTNLVASGQNGTWTVQPGNTANTTPWLMSISAGGNTGAVKAASTAAIATDPAAVVAISPNNTVAVTESGTWTVQPGNTANTTPWLMSPSTGGNTAAVKAASTAAIATDPALVVAVSPNNTIAATQSGTWTAATNSESTIAPGTAPTKAQVIGAVYTATAPTLTDGQTAALRLDPDGALIAYAPNITTTGNITTQNLNMGGTPTAGSSVATITDGRGVGTVQVTGTWTGTLSLQLTNDGTNWVTAGGSPFQNDNTGSFSSTIASGSTGIWTIEVAGHAQWRITASAAMSGTAVVTIIAAQGTDRVNIGNSPMVAAQGIVAEGAAAGGYNVLRMGGWNGTNLYTLKTDASGQLLMGATANVLGKVGIDQTTPGTTNLVSAGQNGSWTVATNADGTIAAGTAPSKSLIGGAIYNSSPITLTTGQGAALQGDANGFLKVNIPALPALATGSNVVGAVTQSGTWTAATNADAAIAPGTAPSKALVGGGVYNSTPPTLTNGQTAATQIDADGSAYNNVRDWTVTAPTPVHYISAATNNSTNVKASAGVVYSITAVNVTATLYYLKLYDKATAPTCGTDTPVHTLPVPASTAGSGLTINPFLGLNFAAGIGFCLVAAIADNDNTSAAASAVVINLGYK